MTEIKGIEISDGEFFQRLSSEINNFEEILAGERAYNFFVKELMTALDNTAKNLSAASYSAGLNGDVVNYYRLEGKAKAFNEIHERVAKEYSLARQYKLYPPRDKEWEIREYLDGMVEQAFPNDKFRGDKRWDMIKRRMSQIIGEALLEGYKMGQMSQLLEEDDNKNA